MTPKLAVIVASTRPGRAGLPVARWFESLALAHGGFRVELVDLAAVDLPLMDEPEHPRLRRYAHAHTKRWSATVDAADAFVFVMPEYNFGFNAALKNALDFLHHEWHYKPVGLVSYGGVAGGTRAAQMIKQVVTALRMVPVHDSVPIPFVHDRIDGDAFHADAALDQGAERMLTELARMDGALRPLRCASEARP